MSYRKNDSNYAIVGAVIVLLLGIVLVPVTIFLAAYIGVQIVTLILAGSYWNAFWWSCLYSLFYIVGALFSSGRK